MEGGPGAGKFVCHGQLPRRRASLVGCAVRVLSQSGREIIAWTAKKRPARARPAAGDGAAAAGGGGGRG